MRSKTSRGPASWGSGTSRTSISRSRVSNAAFMIASRSPPSIRQRPDLVCQVVSANLHLEALRFAFGTYRGKTLEIAVVDEVPLQRVTPLLGAGGAARLQHRLAIDQSQALAARRL